MNAAASPVARLLAAHGGSPADLVVVVDDVALDLGHPPGPRAGEPRRPQRPALAHRDARHRGVRPGPDRGPARATCPEDLAEYVLADFPPDEVLVVQEAVGLAADAVVCLLEEGAAAAMNRFNARRP